MLNQIAAQRLRETYSGEVEGMMDISQLLDDLKIAKHAREWENAARICREGVVATETGRFADWYAFRFNLVFCLREIGDDLAIDEAISVCRGILTRAQAEGVLHKLSVVNGMLAALYENRRNGVRSQNLEAAVTYHAMSLNWTDPRKESLWWATIVVLLGEAHVELEKLLGSLHEGARCVAQLLRTAIRVFAHNHCLDEARNASRILGEVLNRKRHH